MKLQAFYDKEIPKTDSNYTCLAVIILDCARKNDEAVFKRM